jgi:hypothetical protein
MRQFSKPLSPRICILHNQLSKSYSFVEWKKNCMFIRGTIINKCGGAEWIQLAKGKVQWRAFVNAVWTSELKERRGISWPSQQPSAFQVTPYTVVLIGYHCTVIPSNAGVTRSVTACSTKPLYLQLSYVKADAYKRPAPKPLQIHALLGTKHLQSA